MKIISGRWRGRNFYTAKGTKARPTSNMVREALFNILFDKIDSAIVVDLFAGSGGFGFEALSRGASKVHFCDYERKSIRTIEGYLKDFKAQDEKYSLYAMDYKRAISKMLSNGVLSDIIYVDPPYKSNIYEDILKMCVSLINVDGIIIIEHDKRNDIIMYDGYTYLNKKRYGNTAISIFQYKGTL